jgi:hypothetical protein
MQAWSTIAIIAAAMLIAMQAGCDPFAQGAAAAPRVVGHDLTDDDRSSGGGKLEQDPTDDGFIIIECVAHLGHYGDHGPFDENAHREFLKVRRLEPRFATIPRIPLGPSGCSSPDDGRIR